MGDWWRWTADWSGVAPTLIAGVSASCCRPSQHHKVQKKLSSGTGSLGWSWRKGRKTVVVWCVTDRCCTVHSQLNRYQLFAGLLTAATTAPLMTIYSRQPLINFLHLLSSIASCFFRCQAWQSFFTTSFQVFFGLPILYPALHNSYADGPYQVW